MKIKCNLSYAEISTNQRAMSRPHDLIEPIRMAKKQCSVTLKIMFKGSGPGYH